MQLSAKLLAEFLGGEIEGDPEVLVSKPSRIEDGGVGTISFLNNEKYEDYVYHTDASVILVNKKFSPREAVRSTLIRVDDVYLSIALLLDKFGQSSLEVSGIADSAVIHPEANLGASVSVGAATVVERGVSIGAHSIIGTQVYIGSQVKIGRGVRLYPGVKIFKECEIGDNCIIHANTVIGSDGFGFAPKVDGSYRKLTHMGNVILEPDVEIGANTTVDRATMGSTFIRQGVKLDNLVQVGHNADIGAHTVIAAQTGIAGSTKIGRYCKIGGQVGFVGHITIADHTNIQAQSGIASAVKKPGTSLFGSPAIPYNDFIRSFIVFKKLPDLYRRLSRLEKATGKSSGRS